MADERSTTNEAAALLRRAASLLTQGNGRTTLQTTNNNNVIDVNRGVKRVSIRLHASLPEILIRMPSAHK